MPKFFIKVLNQNVFLFCNSNLTKRKIIWNYFTPCCVPNFFSREFYFLTKSGKKSGRVSPETKILTEQFYLKSCFYFQISRGILLSTTKHSLLGVPIVAQWLTNPTRNHEVVGLIPGLVQWVKDPKLPWAVVWAADTARIPRWRRPAATALIRPLAWEPPYAAGVATEKTKEKKQKQKTPNHSLLDFSSKIGPPSFLLCNSSLHFWLYLPIY